MLIAEIILVSVSLYAVGGLLFGVAFVACGAERVDPAARGTSLGFRLLILPGTVAVWPFLAARWLQARRERNHA